MRFNVWNGAPETAEVYKSLKVDRGEGCLVRIWRGRAKKPYANYLCCSVEQRDEYIEKEKRREDARLEFKAEQKAKEQERLGEMRANLTVGTILHYSWGYEQTQCEFFQIVERCGRTVAIIQRIGSMVVQGSEGFMSDRRKPDPSVFVGKPKRKRITAWGIKMDHGWAAPTDEEKAYHCSWYA